MPNSPVRDESYKLLFGHPAMMTALLRCIAGSTSGTPDDWLSSVDLQTLAPLPTEHISDRLAQQRNDLIWQLRRTDGRDLYLLVMLEHQSGNDLSMALRMFTYRGLLYENLLRSKQAKLSDGLPVLLPIVLYSGVETWTAKTDMAELMQPAPTGLKPYQPAHRYLLVDEAKVADDPAAPQDNLATLLFRLEHNKGIDDAQQTLQKIYDITPNQRELRRAFLAWAKYVLLPRALPDVKLPEIHDFLEVRDMLTQNTRSWTEQWKQQGVAEGKAAGKAEGRAEGITRTLTILLQAKFGALPAWVDTRLQEADESHLLQWTTRVLTAPALEDVFRAH